MAKNTCECEVGFLDCNGRSDDGCEFPGRVCGDLFCWPKCKSDQYCDDLQYDPPVCLSVCTDTPEGCRDGLVCDVTSKKCVPPSCLGEQCELGQGCYDLTNFPVVETDTPDVRCTCLPLVTDNSGATVIADTCVAFGKICELDLALSTGKCRKPREYEPCDAKVGCDYGLECKPSPLGVGNACVKGCTSSAECRDLEQICGSASDPDPSRRGVCLFNYCVTSTADRARYFKPCDAAGHDDGTCVPYSYPAGGDVGMCRQAGSAPSLGQCDPDADRTNFAGLCPVGQKCAPLQPSADGTTAVGVCRKMCNAAPGPNPDPDPATTPEAACDATTSGGGACVDDTGIDYRALPHTNLEVRRGLCRPACDVLAGGGMDCPAADVLGNAYGCQPLPNDLTGAGYCAPLQPGAGALNHGCAYGGQFELREQCQGAALCESGICAAYCSLRECSRTGPCAACRNDRMVCRPVDASQGASDSVGICALP